MNDLMIRLVWLSLQAAGVALVGIALSTLVARRTPGAGATTALTALCAILVLLVLVVCPLPCWWGWDARMLVETTPDEGKRAADEVHSTPGEQGSTADHVAPQRSISLTWFLGTVKDIGKKATRWERIQGSSWNWLEVGSVVVCTGMGLGLLRLVFGLWLIRRGWRGCRVVEDGNLLSLVEELRAALHVKVPVAVWESSDLATAAVVGWRHPTLVLSTEWQSWTDTQRRAVVAHELAHIARGDFGGWVVARLNVALLFWHPLVRWLAARLQLHQELAADAVAAAYVGGRPTYLRALAELTLAGDRRQSPSWMVPGFWSGTGILTRRIAMLRVKDDNRTKRTATLWRCLPFVGIVGLGLALSLVRAPVGHALAEPNAVSAAARNVQDTAFDLSLLPRHSDHPEDGVYGFRPSALLKRPELKPLVAILNHELVSLGKQLTPGGIDFSIEDIDQIMGCLYFQGENQPKKRALLSSLSVVRTCRDMDWNKLRDQCGVYLKKHQWKGETYVSLNPAKDGPLDYKLVAGLMGAVTNGKEPFCLWGADSRTLIMEGESGIKAAIEAKLTHTKQIARHGYAAGWDLVSHGFLAVALDNHDQRLGKTNGHPG